MPIMLPVHISAVRCRLDASVLCSAKDAVLILSLGAAPQVFHRYSRAGAESAIHLNSSPQLPHGFEQHDPDSRGQIQTSGAAHRNRDAVVDVRCEQ